jgi:hypothetical protein
MGLVGVDWTWLPQNKAQRQALMNATINLRVPYNAVRLLVWEATISLTSKILLYGISTKPDRISSFVSWSVLVVSFCMICVFVCMRYVHCVSDSCICVYVICALCMWLVYLCVCDMCIVYVTRIFTCCIVVVIMALGKPPFKFWNKSKKPKNLWENSLFVVFPVIDITHSPYSNQISVWYASYNMKFADLRTAVIAHRLNMNQTNTALSVSILFNTRSKILALHRTDWLDPHSVPDMNIQPNWHFGPLVT